MTSLRFTLAIIAFAFGQVALPAFAAPSAVPTHTWPMFQYSADHNATFTDPAWDVAWRADMGTKSNGGLSVVGTTVYVDTTGFQVYAFDALTGNKLWQRALPNVLMNTPVVTNGVVIVGTGKASMVADSPTLWISGQASGDSIYGLSATTGAVLWRYDTVGENMATGTLVANGRSQEFVFTNGDDHVYALDPASGKLLWEKTTLGIDGMASLVAVNNVVYGLSTMGDAGYFQMLETNQEMAAQWSHTWAIDPNGNYLWQAPFGVADASVTVGDGLVFTQGFQMANPTGAAAAARAKAIGWGAFMDTEAQFNTVLSALDLTTGKQVWQYVGDPGPNLTFGSSTFTSDALFIDHRVYEPLAFPKEFAAFDAQTGTLLWKIHTLYPVKTSPVLTNGTLIFGDSGANLYVVRASDGTIEHTLSIPGPPAKYGFTKTAPVIVGNTLFITADRWLYAWRVSDLLNGVISPDGAPPKIGPHSDWCVFDAPCPMN